VNGTGPRATVVVLASALLLSGLAALAVHNLGYTGMWWDEAAQFWISQGLSNYSPPFSQPGGVRDVARMNARENLDPGGFSILLHLWTACGRGIAWLRALPFGFFVLAALALGLLGWRLTRSVVFGVAASAVPLLYPTALYFALEIRAYSMEMAGLVLGVFALVLVHEHPSVTRASLLGLTCAAFVSSRYSFILVTLALAVALGQGRERGAPRASGPRLLLAAILPVLVTAVSVWWFMLRLQAWPAMKGGPLGIISPPYTRTAVLHPGANALGTVRRNLLSPEALPITVCLLVVVLIRRHVYGGLTESVNHAELGRSRRTYAMLYTFILGLQTVSAAASALGMYPWDITARWSAYLVMLSAVAAVVLAAEARSLVLARLARTGNGGFLRRHMRLLGSALAVMVVVAASVRSSLHRQLVEGPHRTDVALQLDTLPRALPDHSVFVALYQAPVVRYLCEYGPSAGYPGYPRIFRFETKAESQAQEPIAAGAEGISFIVSSLPIADVQARFPGLTLQTFGPAGSLLLAVSTPPGPSKLPPT
jgi:hypothetical protein